MEGNQNSAIHVEKQVCIAPGETGKQKQCSKKLRSGKPNLKILLMENVPINFLRRNIEIYLTKRLLTDCDVKQK